MQLKFLSQQCLPAKLSTGPSIPSQWRPTPMSCRSSPRRWATITAAVDLTKKEKVVVILGATGSGKSRLAVDLALHFPSEIINSDKMQVYEGLDIATNKIPMEDRFGVPHHMIGFFDPEMGEFTSSEFRSLGQSLIADISSRKHLPIIAGGSNSFIYALLAEEFNPEIDVFKGLNPLSSELRYDCCFLWVDVLFPVLSDYLSRRVDEMLDSGMLDELIRYYESNPNASDDSLTPMGLRKTIGVPEFLRYYKKCRSPGTVGSDSNAIVRRAIREAAQAMKDNTIELAQRQVGKIQRLQEAGWELRRLDATEALREKMARPDAGDSRARAEIWERHMLQPTINVVQRFLEE